MKKLFIMVFFIAIFFAVSFSSACVSFPKIETLNNCTLELESNYNDEVEVLSYLNQNKDKCSIQNSEISDLKDFIINGYSVKEQSQEEYLLFLEEAEELSNKTGCSEYYLAVARKGRFTGYVLAYKSGGINGTICPAPSCKSVSANIIWNDLNTNQTITEIAEVKTSKLPYFILSIIIILIIILLILRKFS